MKRASDSQMLTLDGSFGEGGGQIVRSALSLSMITGTPFRIECVRAGRKKPGLLRQHLTCVKAATRIASARVSGAELGATSFTFEPGAINAGVHEFSIGSAGSTTLVFQTIFPALMRADAPSRVTLKGGTHNPFAPTFDYLERVFLPLLARMGAAVEVKLYKAGFFPAGGGSWHALVQPARQLVPLMLDKSGPASNMYARADVANLPFEIAEREAQEAVRLMGWPAATTVVPRSVKADGHGNVLALEIWQGDIAEMFTSFGARELTSEQVAMEAADEARAFLASGVPVGPHLADQLLLPMALAGGGSFVTMRPTEHTATNIAVIEKFLPVEFTVEQLGGEDQWRISVAT
ncbi:MAG: RNA 3'-terminal phosphate cyclase [Hyphomicrobiaceae bacterium]